MKMEEKKENFITELFTAADLEIQDLKCLNRIRFHEILERDGDPEKKLEILKKALSGEEKKLQVAKKSVDKILLGFVEKFPELKNKEEVVEDILWNNVQAYRALILAKEAEFRFYAMFGHELKVRARGGEVDQLFNTGRD